MDQQLIDKIETGLRKELPGIEAQYKMAHVVRKQKPTIPADAKIACTLALLYPKNKNWHLVLIQRSSNNPNDRHGGQISFPGGQQESDDTSLAHTAIREAEEEVGVVPTTVKVLGQLSNLYIPVSNFNVFPFVGVSQSRPSFELQESEVRSILEVPISVLQQKETRQKTDMQISKKMTLKNVPYFNVEGHVVWGATAMILSELLEIIRNN